MPKICNLLSLMQTISRYRVRYAIILALVVMGSVICHATLATPPASIDQLELKLKSQYRTIQKTIYEPPSPRQYPVDYNRRLREWQDDLAQSFAAAARTVQEILKLNPPNADYWRERAETLQLYAQPVSRPDERKVFGSGEVQKAAHIVEMPLPEYTNKARAAKAHGEVRLRLILADDGTVKYVFAMKSMDYGLTESAMKAARQIKFDPALRNGKPASEFFTIVYEFKNGQARPPYIPMTVF